jgi:hypothetical protein
MQIGSYLYPLWADVLGNLMCLVSVGSIVIYAIYAIIDLIKNKKVINIFLKYFFQKPKK